jgi:hypothetical protein
MVPAALAIALALGPDRGPLDCRHDGLAGESLAVAPVPSGSWPRTWPAVIMHDRSAAVSTSRVIRSYRPRAARPALNDGLRPYPGPLDRREDDPQVVEERRFRGEPDVLAEPMAGQGAGLFPGGADAFRDASTARVSM